MSHEIKGTIKNINEEILSNIEKVILTDFAEEQWNQRIGPSAKKEQLNSLLTDLHKSKEIHYHKNFGVIDNDIVFRFYIQHKQNKVAVIDTFYGRISLKPLLNDLENIENRYVYLSIEPDILSKQIFPQPSRTKVKAAEELKSLQEQQKMEKKERKKALRKKTKKKQGLTKGKEEQRKMNSLANPLTFEELLIHNENLFVKEFPANSIKLSYEMIQTISMRADEKAINKPAVQYLFGSLLSITVTEHAFERWNERVGPNQSKSQISELMHQLHQLNRIEYFNHKSKIGLIDEEIVFIYEKIGLNQIIILTFYGRISLKSGLKRLTRLNEFNPRKDAVNLELEVDSKDYLKQTLPLLPFKFSKSTNENELYIIEEYGSKDKTFQFIRIFSDGHLKSIQTTNINSYISNYLKPKIPLKVIQIDKSDNKKKPTKHNSNKKQEHFVRYPWLNYRKYEVLQNKQSDIKREKNIIKKAIKSNSTNPYTTTPKMSDKEFEESLINLFFD